MALTPEQNEILQSLATMIRQSSGGLMSGISSNDSQSGGNTEKKRGKDASEQLLDEARKNDKNLKKLSKSFDEFSKDIVKSLNKSELKKLPKELQKGLEASGNKVAGEMASSLRGIESVLKVGDDIAGRERLINSLKDLKDSKELSSEELENLEKAAVALRIDFYDVVDATTLTVKNFDELEQETIELRNIFEKAVNSTTKWSRTLNTSIEVIKQHSAKLKESFGLFVEENRLMRERASNDASYSDALVGLGISMKDWVTILSDSRATQLAMQSAGRNFTAELTNSSDQLVKYSKDNTQAAQTAALFAKNVSGFGVKQENLGGAVDEQIKMYKENFRVFGMTADAFGKYTDELVNDSDIRNNLSMMAEKERKQFILSIQARESERLAMGYTAEAARELTRLFAKMGGETPKERMKKAAKQRALLGTLGMAGEGVELQRLMVGINQSQNKGADLKRIEEIQRNMANALQQKYSQGLGTEMFFRAFSDKAGVTELSRQIETLTKEGKKIEKGKVDDMRNREVSDTINNILSAVDYINAFQATSVGLLGLILAAIIGKSVLGKLGSAGRGIAKGAGAAASGAKNLIKGGASMVSKGAGAARAGMGAIAASPAALAAGGVLAAGAAGYAAGTLINEQLSEDTKIGIGDAIGPVFDNILSFFGNDDAEERVKAAEERDAKKEAERKELTAARIETDSKIADALNNINIQLKTANDKSTEQVESISALATNMNDQARVNNFN